MSRERPEYLPTEEKKLPSQDINTKEILIEERRIVTITEVEEISPSSFHMDKNEGNPQDRKPLHGDDGQE